MFTIRDNNIEAISMKNQTLLNNLINISKLKTKWELEDFMNSEIKKSFIRGELRYSKESFDIVNIINDRVRKIHALNGYSFYTNVYPMIHLSNDLSEKSNLHFDQHDENDLFTCWFSITDNTYNPISILKFNFKKFKKILSKIPFPKYFLKKINPEIGCLNLWDGHNLHKGNLNVSEKISCAYQMKFSKKKYIYDYSKSIEKNLNFDEAHFSNDYSNNFKKFTNLVLSLDKIKYEENDYKKIFELIQKKLEMQFNKKNEKISFSLSVLAQRIMTHGKKFNITDYEKKVFLFDTCSILLGSENLISLDRICKKLINRKSIKLDYLYKSDFLKCIPKNSYEWNEIVKNN